MAEDDGIAFNAGSHRELIRMVHADFKRVWSNYSNGLIYACGW